MSLEPSSAEGMAESPGGLTEYIVHHLTHNTGEVAGSAFHLDSWIIALALGLLACFLLWSKARKATAGVPSRGQAFVEIIVETPVNLTKRQQELLREFDGAGEKANNHHPESDGFFAKVRELWDDLTD